MVGDSVAILEDYAALATALLTLHQATGTPKWLDAAFRLVDVALDHFADPDEAGRWYDAADDAERLVLRPSFGALVAAEEELGPLFPLVERAAAGGLRLTEMVALFYWPHQA